MPGPDDEDDYRVDKWHGTCSYATNSTPHSIIVCLGKFVVCAFAKCTDQHSSGGAAELIRVNKIIKRLHNGWALSVLYFTISTDCHLEEATTTMEIKVEIQLTLLSTWFEY